MRPRPREPSTRRASSIAALTENVALGLYGYNATLAAVALFLWRRSLIPPLLGMLLSVPLTELVPHARAARPDGTVRPGDLAGSGVRLARWKIIPRAGTPRRRDEGPPRPVDAPIRSPLDPSLGVLPMNLSPQERDKLLIFVAAQVAKARKERGLKLNVPEATALITAELLEMARDGKTVAEIMSAGREILGRRRRHGGRRRDDLHDPGRADVPRRQQAGHDPRADPLTIGAGFPTPRLLGGRT